MTKTHIAFSFFISSIFILNSIFIIRAKNPIYAILLLIGAFCNAAVILILLQADFLAFLFLIVYVGAIAVLFLFVILMLNISAIPLQKESFNFIKINKISLSIFISSLFIFIFTLNIYLPILSKYDNIWMFLKQLINETSLLFINNNQLFLENEKILEFFKFDIPYNYGFEFNQNINTFNSFINIESFTTKFNNIELLGLILYTEFSLQFIISGLILLVAMFGAIILTLPKSNENIILNRRQQINTQIFRNFKNSIFVRVNP